MARIEWIEMRLLNWARWRLMSGAGPLGYASVDLSNPTPTQRDPYAEAPIPTNSIEAAETDDAIRALEPELQKTVWAWYLRRDGLGGALRQLGIGESALHARIERAHRRLADWFNDRQERKRSERARAEGLQASARPGGR